MFNTRHFYNNSRQLNKYLFLVMISIQKEINTVKLILFNHRKACNNEQYTISDQNNILLGDNS